MAPDAADRPRRGAQPPTHPEAVAATAALLRQRMRLAEAFPIAAEDPLDLLPGADSVRLMQVISDLEDQYTVELDDHRVQRARTVGGLAELVVEACQEEANEPG